MDHVTFLREEAEMARTEGVGQTGKGFDDAADEIERLQRFIRERVQDKMVYKQGGYHSRRLFMEAEKLLDDPTYFPGTPKDGTNAT